MFDIMSRTAGVHCMRGAGSGWCCLLFPLPLLWLSIHYTMGTNGDGERFSGPASPEYVWIECGFCAMWIVV